MRSHALAFYRDRIRYSKACSLEIKNGKPDKGWEINEQHGAMDTLPEQETSDVLNHAQAKHLLGSLAIDSESNLIFSPGNDWNAECRWLSDETSIPEF